MLLIIQQNFKIQSIKLQNSNFTKVIKQQSQQLHLRQRQHQLQQLQIHKIVYSLDTLLIVPPEVKEDSCSSFNSDQFDYEGKQAIHTETILEQNFQQQIIQLLWWFDASTQQSLFLVVTKQILYLYKYINEQLVLINQIKQQTIITTVYYYYDQHKTIIVIGLDDGNIHFAYIKPNKEKITFALQKQEIQDAADYVTQITTNPTTMFVTSGDGCVYSYSIENNMELVDISKQHNYELSCMMTNNNRLIIGADTPKLLIYRHNDFSEEVGKVKLESVCNYMLRLQNLLILGLEDGTIRGYNLNNLQYIGVLAKVMQESIDIMNINSDNSLLFVATREGINKIYVYSLLFMQDENIKEKLGLAEKQQKQDDETNYIQLIEEEEEQEPDFSSLFSSSISEQEQKQQIQKPKAYAKNSKVAQKNEFFKDF